MKMITVAREKFGPYIPNTVSWIFFFSTFAFQLGTAVILPLFTGQYSSLYSALAIAGGSNLVPMAWGIIGLVSMGLLAFAIYERIPRLVKFMSGTQVSLWVYAILSYFMAGNIIMALAVALAHALFWSWNFTLRDYGKNKRKVKTSE